MLLFCLITTKWFLSHKLASDAANAHFCRRKMANSPSDKEVYVLALEWSESPYHQGIFRIFLQYSANSQRWSLLARPNPSGARLSSKSGSGSEDPRAIAVQLLKNSFADGRLEFDTITDVGPFEILKSEFVPPRRTLVPTGKRIHPPSRTCEYCAYLRRLEGVAAARARIFDCGLGEWTDKERGINPKNPSGVRRPNLSFTCSQFAPREEMREVSL